ncbi:hypothetical protein D7X33_21075 [Butyricicoccus sp. 1XD8-22]|nr:hypothetical protein D7X33_21075 [Butyricicoccus sp. 1XD8-22]
MKEMILGLAMSILAITILLTIGDLDQYKEQRVRLKNVSEEVAAAAAQYKTLESYADGYLHFNQTEGNKAANYTLQRHMNLNNTLVPQIPNYWINTPNIQYQITYIDYSNYTTYLTNPADTAVAFPKDYTFTHFGETFTTVLFGPSVIVSINAGKPNHRVGFLQDYVNADPGADVIEHGIHTLEE